MRHKLLLLFILLAMGLTACGGKSKDDDEPSPVAACADGRDNDGDGLIDAADPGCSNATDNDESNPPPLPQCGDGLDNDGDGKTDFPNDPGCTSNTDPSEANPSPLPACGDGADNDGDGKIDYPNDPGCSSAADTDEADTLPAPACSDGIDNDGDQLIDFGSGPNNDPGCESANDNDETDPPAAPTRTRYEMSSAINGQCWALKSNGTGNYVVRSANGYSATAVNLADAEAFFMKPSALGKYLFYNSNRQLMTVATAPALGHVASAAATDNAEWTVVGVGDSTVYPPTPVYDREPSKAEVDLFHGFVEPANNKFSAFTIRSQANSANLSVDNTTGAMTVVAAASNPAQSFSFEPTTGCKNFPEANSNFTGTPFSGTQPGSGHVLGHADVHVHISATTFLGGAHWGTPFHKFGVEHALPSCSGLDAHGPTGQLDLVGGVFGTNPNGHATDGWPTFSHWPKRDDLIHEAIYWKWLERSWASGLRVVVNDLVDNETLCELQRNAAGTPTRDCNSMNNAGQQAGTMYGMEDYIDAQYGGRGKGFFQIVHSSDEARQVIEDGKMAVILGIEISELFDCKLKYAPFRMQRPHQEDGSGGLENSYTCTRESIVEQINRIHDWGVRQVISIHEFDNAFGGNGIFDGLVLNMGNREDTGGIPSGDIATMIALFSPSTNPEQFQRFVENLPTTEAPTGEWWTTYNCPIEAQGGNTPSYFTGYLWSSTGGSTQSFLSPPLCVFTGQDGRAGGTTPCYPSGVRQCNARWMTPIGLYTYGEMMKKGFLIDWDHMEMGMKTQLLELTEAQNPVYPIVSTHGTFGGATINQTIRQLRNGGYVYPSNGSSSGFRSNMSETLGIYATAVAGLPENQRPLFGFGYGTDTNGLSAQTGPSGTDVGYPFDLFSGALFSELPEMFSNTTAVSFAAPNSTDAEGNLRREWLQHRDGNAHHGMVSDFVREIVLDGNNKEQIRHLYNSAEAYLQTWQRTEQASARINNPDPAVGGVKLPVAPILRPAPPIGEYAP